MRGEAGFGYGDSVSGVVWYRHCHPIHASEDSDRAGTKEEKDDEIEMQVHYTTMKEKIISKKRDKICTGFFNK